MYLEHWQLTKFPFANTNDESSFFLSSGGEEALASLFYAASSRRPYAILTGPSGVGKSMLLHIARLELMENQCEVGLLKVPTGNADELYGQILSAFDVAPSKSSGVAVDVEALAAFGEGMVSHGTQLVLMIDDADTLRSPACLERLRLLSNFQYNGNFVYTVLLAGSVELFDIIATNRSLLGRLEVQDQLSPFNEEESIAYIQARLAAAGGGPDIIQTDAARKVFDASGGIARNINMLCDKALANAFMNSEKSVKTASVARSVEDLKQTRLST